MAAKDTTTIEMQKHSLSGHEYIKDTLLILQSSVNILAPTVLVLSKDQEALFISQSRAIRELERLQSFSALKLQQYANEKLIGLVSALEYNEDSTVAHCIAEYIALGANINTRNKLGLTILDIVQKTPSYSRVDENRVKFWTAALQKIGAKTFAELNPSQSSGIVNRYASFPVTPTPVTEGPSSGCMLDMNHKNTI